MDKVYGITIRYVPFLLTGSILVFVKINYLDADHPIDHDHTSCVAHGLTFHPVISNVRDACTCYQPQEEEVLSYQVC